MRVLLSCSDNFLLPADLQSAIIIVIKIQMITTIYAVKNKASDFWFHLKDRPSSHVIVQNTKKSIPESVIEKAAIICAQFSTDHSGTYEVDYTQRRNVKIQNGANVLYNPYTTTVVKT